MSKKIMADNLQEQIKRLNKFNNNVDSLTSYSFLKIEKVGVSMSKEEEEAYKIKTLGPSEEATSAFISKFRLFFMDKDGISFRALEKIYDNLPISEQFRQDYKKLRQKINDYLDSETGIDRRLSQPKTKNVVSDYISEQQLNQIAIDALIKGYDKSNIDWMTRREILENIMWCAYSHTEFEPSNRNANRGEIIEAWQSSSAWNFIEMEFICIVMTVTQFAIAIKYLNELVIEEIEKTC
jgi:hypothetical protein